METWEKVLLLVLGVAVGAGITFVLTRPRADAQPTSYAVARTYSNTEEWEIIRDEKTGRVKGVKAHRRAEET